MKIELPYGAGKMSAEMDWGRSLGTLDIADIPPVADPHEALADALADPIGQNALFFDGIEPGSTAAIVVSDSFRRTAVDRILEPLVDRLNTAGIDDDHITIIVSTGTHRGPTPEELAEILGPAVFKRLDARAITHDPHTPGELVYLGDTSRGTPVEVNRRSQECDYVIATGTVILHYFAGYGGGRKSLVPGLASARTIAHNHAMNLDPKDDRLNPAVKIGALDGNPVSEDMLEAARMMKCDLIVNTVLNRRGEIAKIVAGDMDGAHRAAVEFARMVYTVPIREKADLAIASSGATRNFVQTHKALYNAYSAVKPGGRVILLAEAPEGLGGEQFVQWLRYGTPQEVIAQLRKQSEINGQTALSTLQKSPQTTFVTALSDDDVALLRGTKAPDLANALDDAKKKLNRLGIADPTYYVMPSAAYTVPVEES